MNRINKIIALCLILSMMLTFFVACSPSIEDVVGTYTGEYDFNDNTYTVVITLLDDGKYVKTKAKNNDNLSTETGDYEIDGRKINLYDSKSLTYHGTCTVYEYKNNSLENNGHEFVKQ